MAWSLNSFVLHAGFWAGETLLLHRIMLFIGAVTVIAYYHFVCDYFRRIDRIMLYVGYGFLVVFIVLLARGYIVTSSEVSGGLLNFEFDNWFLLVELYGMVFIGTALYRLISGFTASVNPEERNRIGHLIAAIVVWMLFMGMNLVPALAPYSIDHVGCLLNALILGLAITWPKLPDISLVIRRGASYLLSALVILGGGAGVTIVALSYMGHLPTPVVIVVTALVVALLAVLFYPLRHALEYLIDRLFFREAYRYRKALAGFVPRAGHILDMEQLAEEMLPLLYHALEIRSISLVVFDGNGGLEGEFSYPEDTGSGSLNPNGTSISAALGADSPLVRWLSRTAKPVYIYELDSIPELKGLWHDERDALRKLAVELMYPLLSRGELIGILALGPKISGRKLSYGDMELLGSFASQAGIILDNARLYKEAVEAAITDDLTGLYNHRYFEERISEEMARGTRTGGRFSLLMIDVDKLKICNDVYGHQAGDRLLRHIARCMRESFRSIDLGFRYGGDEFIVLMPGSSGSGVVKAAERLRKKVTEGAAQVACSGTISIGVASWPNDGVSVDELLFKADSALYQAKQEGGNKVVHVMDRVALREGMQTPARVHDSDSMSLVTQLSNTWDAYAPGHSQRVSSYASMLARALGMPPEEVRLVELAGLVHDLGKSMLPGARADHPGPLSEDEWRAMRQHPGIGAEILQSLSLLGECSRIVRYHHERYDGTGYPDGLRGEDIPLDARIMAIADSYDAMTSDRSYRPSLGKDEALAELRRNAGTQFDPELVEIFCRLIMADESSLRLEE